MRMDYLQTPVETPHRPRFNEEDLCRATGLSAATIAKMGSDDNVTTDMMSRICKELHCCLEQVYLGYGFHSCWRRAQ
ncbi:helix-turn-helix domain-containing protein [Rothia nasimurium]|uniref:helix-turn-helix domain-containing protein n=1 Tax=Rothia nasimurium TaxID=85336 RepID=UPI0027DCE659|nr:helix-turn-helix transcriptional regulator [Rothia nasimurium]